MSFLIAIPEELGDKSLVRFFKGWTWHDDPESPVCLDFGRVDFIAPWAATLFGAYGVWLQEVRHKQVDLRLDPETYAGRFLQSLGLPQLIGNHQSNEVASEDKICPLSRISTSKEVAPFVSSVMRLLAIDDEEMAGAVKYSMIELLRNVVQHARSRIGATASAVYYPKTGLVDVVVADIGCGIRASLRERYREINSDQKAVRFALQPHVSGTFSRGEYQSMMDNAGLGLFFIKEIVSRSGGGFFLASGTMMANLWGNLDGTPGKRYIQANSPGWRGTFALLQFRRNMIAEFGALLATCREIAAEVRKDPRELVVDFLDEVPEIEGLVVVHVGEFEEDVEQASHVREEVVFPALAAGEIVVLDFQGIRAATQSFVHALMYRVFRDGENLETCLSVAGADSATEEAIRAVTAYATVEQRSL